MQAELNSDAALTAANELLSHLRKYPAAASQPAHDLAARFGLEESFVSQMLQSIHSNRRAETRPAVRKPSLLSSLAAFLQRTWVRATARPVLFVAVTFLASFAIMFAEPRLIALTQIAGSDAKDIISILFIVGVSGVTFILHMGAYFAHRSPRNALWGGLMLFGAMVAFLGYGMLHGKVHGSGVPNVVVLFLVGTMAMLMMSVLYSGFGALAAVLGGWFRIKLQDRAEETMTRQELLERYFELQSRLRLSASPRPSNLEPPIFAKPLVNWYRKNQIVPNFVVGFVLSGIELISLKVSGITPGQTEFHNQINIWFFVLILAGIAGFLFRILQGYLSRSAWQAILGSFFLSLGGAVGKYLVFRTLAVVSVTSTAQIATEVVDTILMIGVSCAGYLGAIVQKRAARESNLQQNDQATLLGEMVRIQWKLSNEAATVCVMVVDAARSSEMKAAADPLTVEYSFREYQEWIEKISSERGGRVHSTAGDGAVVAFSDCPPALDAARAIQSEVFDFNKNVNRLTLPFRLRIGLHTGEVAGDINKVQFTEVIDIAAHIEKACPIGGIAVTDEVAQRLPEEQFTDLETEIDGHRVFLAANPEVNA